ncbi:ATP-binding protein [Ornithinimicrobium ciconiae]|uniref:histidine kinase n=1 Tax=Ornithinimicrobium ciconiae TaxID=2594265 RepID=A0A516G9T0_9MICO|nr:ATP-binding protein [Ornithinimicrobium ciconiae]QDO88286.1 ATP-binding protein [Ornithinimicrobium ciconiae]
MDAADLQPIELFDGLSTEQLNALLAAGEEVAFGPGDLLWAEGARADDWWVLIDGVVELVRRTEREDMVVGLMDAPGRWAGGFRAWVETGRFLASARGLEAGRMLRVPATSLRDLTAQWFPFGSHLIKGVYGMALYVESTARQRDSLANLGKLAAGLAHEINNPSAAATRATAALGAADETLFASLSQLAAHGIAPEQFTALDELRRELAARPAPAYVDLSEIEDSLAERLESAGVDRTWSLAPVLASANADEEWCDRLGSAVDRRSLQAGLDWIVASLQSTVLRAEITESTRRISELVAAVRSYSQVDRAALQPLAVAEGLESTLLVLGHRLREGTFEVIKEYADVPRIEGYAGELNQVWTNLIGNALDAMGGTGTLRLTTRGGADGGVVVEIGDSGPGLPSAVAERAFEAFYTTKPVGQGTGLGLDIARRIVVERHGGTIEIESEPGDTTFRVSLPAAPPTT